MSMSVIVVGHVFVFLSSVFCRRLFDYNLICFCVGVEKACVFISTFFLFGEACSFDTSNLLRYKLRLTIHKMIDKVLRNNDVINLMHC